MDVLTVRAFGLLAQWYSKEASKMRHQIYTKQVRIASPKFHKKLLPWMIAVALQPSLAMAIDANALPTNGQVIAGSAAIAQNANNMVINQSSQNVFINWDTFNIGSNAAVNFIQPSANAMAVNQVVTNVPTQIMGQLTANAGVVVLNSAGVVITNGAVINAGSFVAAGQSGQNANITDGQMRFMNTQQGGSVINQGQINAKEGGYVALVGATVNNSGQITAPGGTVALAAGQEVRLEITGNSLVGVKVDGAAVNASIDNSGVIAADGGKVIISSKQAAGALSAAINQTGTIRANSISTKNGEIWLDGGAGAVNVAGSVDAKGVNAGETGGKVVATGGAVTVTGIVDASGAAAGGQVYVGGGWQGKDPAINEAKTVTIANNAVVKADATANGNGGKVVAWSADHTNVQGTISAKGAGTGKGGNVETSAKNLLGVSGKIEVGEGGTWLLDPTNLTVTSLNTDPSVSGGPPATNGTNATVYSGSISTALSAGTSVTLQADDNITIDDNISKTAGGNATLLLSAGRDIILNTGKKISSTVGKLNITFGASLDTDVVDTVELFGQINTNGGDVVFNKATTLRHANPISTQITESVGAGVVSGNITFNSDVVLAADTYTVTLGAQGRQSNGVYTNLGGDVVFNGTISSGTPVISSSLLTAQTQSPQALTINNTGLTGVGVTAKTITFNDDVGTVALPLKSLTLLGATDIFLNASEINLQNTDNTTGNLFTATTNFSGAPRIILGAADTIINITGGVVSGLSDGYADYKQDTFDIVKGITLDQTLTINAARSIKVNNRSISGAVDDATTNAGILNVALNPFTAAGAGSGSIQLTNATINSNGGYIKLAGVNNADSNTLPGHDASSANHFAVGNVSDPEGVAHGILIHNTDLLSNNGAITIFGKAPTVIGGSSVAGVKISGAATEILSGTGNITIEGRVTHATDGGSKDAVIIGEGAAARSTIEATSGNIRIVGDASYIDIGTVDGGSRYDGLILSSKALIKTGSGNIELLGRGGGGDQSFLEENHGIRIEDTETSVLSTSGDISLFGASGGKTSAQGDNSFGIYAKGFAMYIGKDASKSAASGDISFTADSMEFVNTNANRLQVASSGELWIKPETITTNIQFGSAGTMPVAVGVKTLYLGEDWFNGSAVGVFQPGPVVTVAVTDAGTTTTKAQQTLAIQGNSGGTFTLRTGSATNDVTADIAFSTTPETLRANIESALNTELGASSVVVTSLGNSNFRIDYQQDGVRSELQVAGSKGFADITIGADNLTGQMLLASPTTFRDDVALVMGTPIAQDIRSIALNADLTVVQQPNNDDGRHLTLNVGRGVTQIAGAKITVQNLTMLGGGDSALVGGNLVKTLAINGTSGFAGSVTFKNAQTLEVGSTTTTQGFDDDAAPQGSNADNSQTATNGITLAQGKQLDIATSARTLSTTEKEWITAPAAAALEAGNLILTKDVVVTDNVANHTGVVNLVAAGRIEEFDNTGVVASKIIVDKLHVSAGTGLSTLNGDNQVNILATDMTANGTGVEFKNTHALSIGQVAVTTLTPDSIGKINASGTVSTNYNGINNNATTANGGNTVLHIASGNLIQQATTGDIKANNFLVRAVNGHVILENITNDVNLLTAQLDGDNTNFSFRDADDLTIGTVSGVTAALLSAGTSQSGITTYDTGSIQVATGAGTLTVARNVTATGAGTVDLRAGGTSSDIAINPENGQTATISSGVTNATAIQLVAGNAITTNTNNSTHTEIDTAGNVIMKAGNGGIGADGKRIEMANAAKLAATATGDMWLRKLDSTNDNLTIDSVSAINTAQTLGGVTAPDALAFGGAITNLDGLTTDNNGSITLTVDNGSIDINKSIVAHGSGNVDFRAEKVDGNDSKNINFNGFGVSSSSGIIQLVAKGSFITTDTTGASNDTANSGTLVEVSSSAGSIRLEAETGSIGASNAKIETNTVTLSALAAQNVWLSEVVAGGALVIDSVAGVNGRSALNDITATAGSAYLDVKAGTLTLRDDVVARNDVDLRALGASSDIVFDHVNDDVQARSTLGTGTLQLVAGQSVTTTDATGSGSDTANSGTRVELLSTTGNVRIEALAGSIGGALAKIEMDTATVAAVAAQDVWLSENSVNGLIVDQVSAINAGRSALNDITATAGSAYLDVKAGTLTLRDDVRAAINIDLRAVSGDITQENASLFSPNLVIKASGNATLGSESNDVDLIAANTGGTFNYVDADGVTVGSVTTADAPLNGITTTSDDVSLRMVDGGILLNQNINTGTVATVVLDTSTNGEVTGTAAGVIADALLVKAKNASTLNSGANAVNVFAAQINTADINNADLAQALTFTNSQTFSVGTVAGVNGVTTTGDNINLTATAGDLRIAQAISTGTPTLGTIALEATTPAGSILRTASAGNLTTNSLVAQAGKDVLLTMPNDAQYATATQLFDMAHANNVVKLAGKATNGRFAYADISELEIDTVNGINGIQAQSVWVRVKEQMVVNKQILATGTDRNTIVLAVDANNYASVNSGKFINNAGAQAVSAPNGRWLIYDNNPMNDLTRLDGLRPDFRLFSAMYDSNKPAYVLQGGNGYLATTPALDTEQYVRPVSGDNPSSMNAGPNSTGSLIQASIGMTPKPVVSVETQLQPVAIKAPGSQAGVPMVSSNVGSNATFIAPLRVSVVPGSGFRTQLSSIAGDTARVQTQPTLADGSPLPSWLSWNASEMSLSAAQVPANLTTAFVVRVNVVDAVGVNRVLDVVVNPSGIVALKE